MGTTTVRAAEYNGEGRLQDDLRAALERVEVRALEPGLSIIGRCLEAAA